MNNQSNPQLQLANDFVRFTGRHIFLTGKAGTGKTTFLHDLKKNSPKRMVVVAPTGVAAINAGGMTMHSFFQLPFGPVLPGSGMHTGLSGKQPTYKRYSKEKQNIIKSLDLLVIDEISMVRADMMDGVDEVLRRFRKSDLPFGGVQLLMIGDMQQLAPVVKDDEWKILKQYYDTVFFFGSNALNKTNYVSIELHHVYRQRDSRFISLLNKIRDNKIDDETIDLLNSRHTAGSSSDQEGYIILTTHNAKAKNINDSKLHSLPDKPMKFKAEITGNFPEYNFPTEPELILKTGAQVMFNKNDPSVDKQFFNGKIGKIIAFEEDNIMVKCPEDKYPIAVEPLEWQNVKYSLNTENKEIEESIEGTFTQVPLKLAWAITIHKSQGLTFDKAIIDAQAAFAFGQVYVALSRCRTLEGLVLKTPINKHNVKSNETINSFTRDVENNQPDQKQLDDSVNIYQEEQLTDLYDFSFLQKHIYQFMKIVRENASSLPDGLLPKIKSINEIFQDEIREVSLKFINQLSNLLAKGGGIENNKALQERVCKASNYFSEKLEKNIIDNISGFSIETDNKKLKKYAKDVFDSLFKETMFKIACLRSCRTGFILKDYLILKAKASIEDYQTKRRAKKTDNTDVTIDRPDLYNLLINWRNNKARAMNMDVYMVLQLKSIRDMASKVPSTRKDLKAIHGFGKKKLEIFGDELLERLNKYRSDHGMEILPAEEPEEKPKKPKISTREVTLNFWNSGMDARQIAKERELAITTIEGHLALLVGDGILAVEQLVSEEKINNIKAYYLKHEPEGLTIMKEALGDDYSYSELRYVVNHLKFEGSISNMKS